jgi:hypothetical protein
MINKFKYLISNKIGNNKLEFVNKKKFYLTNIYFKGLRNRNKSKMFLGKSGKWISVKDMTVIYDKFIFLSKLNNDNDIKFNSIKNKLRYKPIYFFIKNNVRFRELLGNYVKNSIEVKNIYNNHIYNVNNRKMSKNLESPYYFFSSKYNEQSNLYLSQIRHWYTSNYSYINRNMIKNNLLDIYTNKLVNMFFSVKYVNIRNPFKRSLDKNKWKVIKIKPDVSFITDLNIVKRYTSNRTYYLLKKLKFNFNYGNLSKNGWIKKQFSFLNNINMLIHEKFTKLIFSRTIKEENYISRLRKPLLSKPLFKHTPFNLIIDLFIFNNKTYKFNKLENLLMRRTLYKYMYSMYENYTKKIEISLERPRFFYINLIEPKVRYYYNNIINTYDKLLFKYNKNFMVYLYIMLLELNYIYWNKMKNIKNALKIVRPLYNNVQWEKKIENNHKFNIDNKENLDNINIRIRNKIYDKIYYSIKKRKIEYELKKYLHKNNLEQKEKINGIPLSSKSKSQKKYLLEIKEKNNIQLDEKKLTLWNTKGLNINVKEKRKKHEKKFRQDKFSYVEFKKRNLYDVRGRKISPKMWKKKLMSYYLFSQIQKKNTNRNVKIFNKYIRGQNLNKEKIIPKYRSDIIQNSNKMIIGEKNKDNVKIKINYNNKNYNISSLNALKCNNKMGNIDLDMYDLSNTKKKYSEYIKTLFKSFYLVSSSEKIKLSDKKKNIDNINITKEFLLKLSKKLKEIMKEKKILFTVNSVKTIQNQLSIMEKIIRSKNKKEVTRGIKLNIKNSIEINNFNSKITNSNFMWNNLDNSLIKILNNLLKVKKYYLDKDVHSFFNEIRNLKNHGNTWYLIYFYNYIKREFDLINSNIISDEKKNNSMIGNNILVKDNSYLNIISEGNLKKEYEERMWNKTGNYWLNFFVNNREGHLIYKFNYNEKLFKPYYRFLLPKLIISKYIHFISLIGYKHELFFYNESKKDKNNNFTRYSFMIFNFVLVKIMFDLLRYNYRGLIRINPKYYFLNNIKYYENKYKKLILNIWFNSFDYLKRLRKTPLKFWERYDKLTKFYLKQILNNANLDTNKKIFIPFVVYFEDILYNIYDKPVLIRLWPLKRLYLSSYILAGRILSLILWRHKINSYIRKHNFQKLTYLLMNTVRLLQINKTYDYYKNNIIFWPNILTKVLNKRVSSSILNYNDSGYYSSDKDKDVISRIFALKNSNLFNYVYTGKFNYKKEVYSFLMRKKIVRNQLKWKLKSGEMSVLNFTYFWLRPLNYYFMSLKRYLDITGIKFVLSGKAGNKSNNTRSFYRTKRYGNLIGPWYTGLKTFRKNTEPTSYLRGEIMSHLDYTNEFSKSRNGAISLKIWISSRIGGDIHDLLIHLIRIKHLYNQIINRYYLVDKLFTKLEKIDLSKSVNTSVSVKRKLTNAVVTNKKIV